MCYGANGRRFLPLVPKGEPRGGARQNHAVQNLSQVTAMKEIYFETGAEANRSYVLAAAG